MSENILPNDNIIKMAEKEEPRLLNILLKDKDLLAAAISFGIKPTESDKPGHFLIPKNNILYHMIYKNYLKYGSILTRSAMDSLIDVQENLSEEERAASKNNWDKIWNRHDASLEDYALLVANANDRYIAWQFYEQWKKGDRIIHSTAGHGDMVKKFMIEMNAMENLNPDPYSLTMSLPEGIKNALVYIEDRRIHPERRDAIKCGIRGIDHIYNGFERGTYTVISGLIGGGKTTLLMNFAFNMAKMGYNVVYVSLEKKADVFFRRLLSLHALTDYNRIKVGGTDQFGLTDYWYNKLQEAAKDLEKTRPNLHCLQFVQNTTLTKILYETDKLRNKQPIDVFIVDYLQVIGVETHTLGRYDIDLANVHKRLMAYGRTNNIVTFTALQLKNSATKEIRNKAKKVTNDSQLSEVAVNTEDYAGSQQVIADADNAIGVVLNGDNPATKMFVSPSKARDDEKSKTISLDFEGRLCKISDPEFGTEQVKAVDKYLYNSEETESTLASEDALFEEVKSKEGGTKNKKSQKSLVNGSNSTATTTTQAIVLPEASTPKKVEDNGIDTDSPFDDDLI